MGSTKNHLFTQEQIELANLFKALAHPARIAIVENLLTHDNLNCSDLKFYIQLSQSTISGHLKQLHDVGILAVEVRTGGAYYQVNADALNQISGYLAYLSPQVSRVNRTNPRLYCKPLRYLSPLQSRYQT